MADIVTEFDKENEEYIKSLTKSVRDKASYDLRRIIGITNRIREKAETGEVDVYGDKVEDWSKIETKELINTLTEGSAWNFYSTPIRMTAFIESSLAEIVYKEEFNKIISDEDLKGTAAVKAATAELATQETQFIYLYRKMYTKTVEEMMKSFELFLKRLESIIWMRQKDENTSPFKA